MIKLSLALLLTFSILAQTAFGLNLSLSPGHYLDAIQFYYKEPKPELIQPMLKAFSQAGLLANAEKRMFTAAFLATLARKGKIRLSDLLKDCQNRDCQITLAWSLHLAGQDPGPLLKNLPAAIADQIRNTPPDLANWDPAWEASVLGMHWAAFMASGDNIWLAKIISLAQKSPPTTTAQKAAATLYDYGPLHPQIEKELRRQIAKAPPAGAERLEVILKHIEAEKAR